MAKKKVACARCRTLKKKCDEETPCTRCKQDCTDCERRPPNEHERLLKRLSRIPNSKQRKREVEEEDEQSEEETATTSTSGGEECITATAPAPPVSSSSAFKLYVGPKRQKLASSHKTPNEKGFLLAVVSSPNPNPATFTNDDTLSDDSASNHSDITFPPSLLATSSHPVFKFIDSISHSSSSTKQEAATTLISEGYDTVESILAATPNEIEGLTALKRAIANSIIRRITSLQQT